MSHSSNSAELHHLTVIPLSEQHAEALSCWRYEPPYDFYNWTKWEVMLQLGIEFGDDHIRSHQYAAVLNEDNDFIGFAQFFPLFGVIRIGLGLRPDLCGRGLGLSLVQAIIAEAARRAPGDVIDLEVHVWNERAIRTYERAGFVITDTYARQTPAGLADVHCMCYEPQTQG